MVDVHRPEAQPRAEDPLAELLRTATGDLSDLFHKELELAKLEIKEDVREAGKVGGMFGGAALAGYLGLLFVSFALAWLLDEFMHRALAFLIVGVLYAIGAAVLFSRGRDKAKHLQPPVEQTRETLKEDVQWAKQQKS